MMFGGSLAIPRAWYDWENAVGYVEGTRRDALWRLWLFISEDALLLIRRGVAAVHVDES